jgi:hypothetical protein
MTVINLADARCHPACSAQSRRHGAMPLEAHGPFAYVVIAQVDTSLADQAPSWSEKRLVGVDPDAEIEDGCPVVVQMADNGLFVMTWRRTGRGEHGRFIPASDPREYFSFDELAFKYQHAEISRMASWLRILGRVVGEPREFTA